MLLSCHKMKTVFQISAGSWEEEGRLDVVCGFTSLKEMFIIKIPSVEKKSS